MMSDASMPNGGGDHAAVPMIINMVTIAVRKTCYLDRTIDSLMSSDGAHLPVNLIMGSSDTSHVEKYRDRFNIVVWDAAAEAQARVGKMRHNCSLNAIRSLRHGDAEYCLCCEDDISFVRDWYRQLMLTLEQIPETDYVLNLGQGCDQSPDKRYATHTRNVLIGAQGIFYPSKRLRDTVATYVDEHINGGMNDALVGRYAKRHAALYNTTPLLVRHIGGVSSFTQPKPPPGEQAKDPPQQAQALARPKPATPVRPAAPAPRPDPRETFRIASEALLATIRASLGTAALPESARWPGDWKQFELLASHHGLGPTVYHVLRDQPGVPADRLKRLKAQYVTNSFHHQVARAGINEISAAFASRGIAFVLTEGSALLRGHYDDSGLGGVTHLGVLVQDSDVELAQAEIRELGYAPADGFEVTNGGAAPSRIRLGYQRAQPPSVPVALRWRVVESYQPYVFDLAVARAQATPLAGAPANALVMAPEHELLRCCLQLERATVTYRSLIQQDDCLSLLLMPRENGRLVALYGIALHLQREPSIDWDRLVADARRWAIAGRVHATLELVQRAVGIGPPPDVLRALAPQRPRFIERIAHELSFSADRAGGMGRWLPSSPTSSDWRAALSAPALRFASAYVAAFPSQEYWRARHMGSEASRVRHLRALLPVVWAEARFRLRDRFTRRGR